MVRGPPAEDSDRRRKTELRWLIRHRLALEPSTEPFTRRELRQIDRRLKKCKLEPDDND